MLCDYHVHSAYSPDGRGTIDEILKSASEKGVSELMLTDHYDAVQNPVFSCEMDMDGYAAEILANKDNKYGIRIGLGIEFGQPHADLKSCQSIIKSYPFDFIIGSVHNINNDKDMFFFDYKEEDHVKLFEIYLGELMEMVKRADFDVMGHLTYPLRYMWDQAKKTIEIEKYEEFWRSLFLALKEKGCGIEINTSGMRQKIGQFLPPLYLTRLYRECGGEIITVGSDAHRPDDLAKDIEGAKVMLIDAGFKYYTRFKGREPIFEAI